MLPIILISFGGFIALLLVLALLMPKNYSISSEIEINSTKATVFNFIKHLKNQEQYNKWVMADPYVKMSYKGIDGTIGSIASWESKEKNVGVGEQEIIKLTEGESYDAEIRFEKPFKGISYANVLLHAISDNQTKVITTFRTTTPFPMNLMVPMIKNMLKKDMDENAQNLKKVLETKT